MTAAEQDSSDIATEFSSIDIFAFGDENYTRIIIIGVQPNGNRERI